MTLENTIVFLRVLEHGIDRIQDEYTIVFLRVLGYSHYGVESVGV
jgi:hypothetical protein